ncbi:hypothetical protein EC988_002384 [Linderina pennispora]|nr:hypothetical protein EC988_002384 [Linderina pennispora]
MCPSLLGSHATSEFRRGKVANADFLIAPPTPRSFNGSTKSQKDGAAPDEGYGGDNSVARSSESSFSIDDSIASAEYIEANLLPSGGETSRCVSDHKSSYPRVSFSASDTKINHGRYSLMGAMSSLSITHTPAGLRHSAFHPIDRHRALGSKGDSRMSMAGSFADSIEVVQLIDSVKVHRKEVSRQAEKAGILDSSVKKGLRGYMTIQEPTCPFWKRRYFVLTEDKLFTYINECSVVPSDVISLGEPLTAPCDVSDDLLIANAISVRFATGEYFFYFDTPQVRKAFEARIQRDTNAPTADS